MADTKEQILQRMLAIVPDEYDKTEGSFFYDSLSPAAIELGQAHMLLDNQLNRAFATSATGSDLDLKVYEQGIVRKPSTKSSGQLTFLGTDDAIIPSGTVAVTQLGVQFETTQEAVIAGGQAIVPAQAVISGASGNAPAGTITGLPVTIAGVDGVSNSSTFTGGYDAELDEDLRRRYFEKLHTPSTSGNKYHYINWAKEVVGVGDAKVFPLWNGNGTVKVVILNSNKKASDQALINSVASYIEEVRPIGACVTVISASEKEIDITATVILANGYTIQQVQELYEESVVEYLKSIAFVDSYISYAQLGKILLETPGVGDYSGLLINNATINITLEDEETPVLGVVSLGV